MAIWTPPSHVTLGDASSTQFNEETVDNLQFLYDRLRCGVASVTADAGGNAIIPHGLGVIPTVVVMTLSTGNTAAVNQVAKLVRTTMDASNFVVNVIRSDTGAVLPGLIKFDWLAMVL